MGKLAIKQTHYNQLKRRVFDLLNKQSVGAAKTGLISTRTRWGIYWASGGAFSNATEYHYLNDSHIDSAMKAILKEYINKARR